MLQRSFLLRQISKIDKDSMQHLLQDRVVPSQLLSQFCSHKQSSFSQFFGEENKHSGSLHSTRRRQQLNDSHKQTMTALNISSSFPILVVLFSTREGIFFSEIDLVLLYDASSFNHQDHHCLFVFPMTKIVQ